MTRRKLVLETCEFRDLHFTRTAFEFHGVVTDVRRFVYVTRSTLPKLGKYGVCSNDIKDAFGLPLYYNNVLYLNMINVKIEEITSDAFIGCSHLETLILRDNKIEILGKNIFNRNVNLTKVDLTNNLIEKLDRNTFEGVTKLKELLLSGNYLKRFSPEIVKTLVDLEELRLDSNDLFDLDAAKLIRYTPNLKRISFMNNQFRCDRVSGIREVLTKIGIDDSFEGELRGRDEPMMIVNGTHCFGNTTWGALHYIYLHDKAMGYNTRSMVNLERDKFSSLKS